MTAPPAPRLRAVRPGQRLTVREREVLLMVSHGMANADIGTRLLVSEETVKTHVRKVSRVWGLFVWCVGKWLSVGCVVAGLAGLS